jgi:hypothetical protein
VLQEIIHQLVESQLNLVQIMSPYIALEYGAGTADQLISAPGEQLRGLLQQLDALQGRTTVRVITSQVQLKPRRRA